MSKISIYVSNELLKPANYYRIVQYAKEIEDAEVHNIYPTRLFEHTIKNRDKFFVRRIYNKLLRRIANKRIIKYLKKDLNNLPKYVVIQKSMTKYMMNRKARKLQEELLSKTKLIWDFDDHIIEDGQIQNEDFLLYASKADKIIVTSNYLKNILPRNSRKKVMLLPTSDMDMYIGKDKLNEVNKSRLSRMDKEIELLWLATSANIPHLKSIVSKLELAAKILEIKYKKKLILKVVCDKKINIKCYHLKIVNIKWTREVAIRETRNASIGIMPLIETNYSKGKGGFKLIQYMSTGLPVIASNVGYNKELFKGDIGYLLDDKKNKASWVDAIVELSTNKDKWTSCSKNALKVWEEHFNAYDNLKVWKNILK